VPQWIKSDLEIREAPALMVAPGPPDINLCDFWRFGMLKEILKDREFNLNNEMKEAIASARNGFPFDEVHGLFCNWMSGLALIIRNGREYLREQIRNNFLIFNGYGNRRGPENVITSREIHLQSRRTTTL
jgi:hypothetical protein